MLSSCRVYSSVSPTSAGSLLARLVTDLMVGKRGAVRSMRVVMTPTYTVSPDVLTAILALVALFGMMPVASATFTS